MKQWRGPKFVTLLGLLALATLLYGIGVKFLFIPMVVASFACLLPFPRLIRSVASRLFFSGMLACGVLQLAIVTQFYLWPQSGFQVIGLLTAIFSLGLVAYGLSRQQPAAEPIVWIDRRDGIALGCALLFVLPLGWYSFGDHGLEHIVSMASVQVPDATNHFISMSGLYETQHIPRGMDYYPVGFDLSTSFIQDSIGLDQTKMAWKDAARLFMAHYTVIGGMLAYSLAYLACLFLERAGDKVRTTRKGFLLVLALGLPLTLLYLVPFVFEGFLNFCYVCATIACSFFYIDAAREAGTPKLARWFLLGYLMLIFGTAMSWPLLTLPLLLVPIMYFWPERLRFREGLRRLLVAGNLPLIAGFAVQLIPLYMVYRYSAPGANSINTPGALTSFHYGTLLLSMALVGLVLYSDKFSDSLKTLVRSIYIPFFLLLVGLMAVQYFTVGELRYYVIKAHYVVELFTVALLAGLLIRATVTAGLGLVKALLLTAVLPLLSFMLLIGIGKANPLDELRKLVPTLSRFGTPIFLDSDITKVVELGAQGKIKHFNMTILHYSPADRKLFAAMQPAYWGNAVTYDTRPDKGDCNIGDIYAVATYQGFSQEQQSKLIEEIRFCQQFARQNQVPYYIVTDTDSAPYVRQLIGGDIVLITQ